MHKEKINIAINFFNRFSYCLVMNKMERIPDNEFKERIHCVKNLMKERGLDLLIIYSNQVDPGNVRYLADYWPIFEQAFVILPLEGEPILLAGAECSSYAKSVSRINDVRLIQDVMIPGEEYPGAKITTWKDVFRDVGESGVISKVGIAGLDVLGGFPIHAFRNLKAALKSKKIVKAENIMIEARSIKSEAELEMIRRAYELADLGLDAAINAVKEGVSERQIQAEAEHAIISAGGEDHPVPWPCQLIASGPNTCLPLSRPSNRRVKRGEHVLLTIGALYEGYNSAVARPLFVGTPSEEYKRVIKVVEETMIAVVNEIKPGAGSEVDRAGRKVLEESGYVKYNPYGLAHSIGLVEAEPPFFGPRTKYTVKPNMVISVDIALFGLKFGGLRYEDGFIVTEKGIEPLSKYTKELLENC
jgi:Xaa-Pro aminopeptidase